VIFFTLFTERWMSATNGMDLLHRGAYIALMVHQYANEVMALPLDMKENYRIAGAHSRAERQAVTHVLRTFYDRNPTGYEQRKVTAEVSRFQAKEPERVIERERTNARKAASRATHKALYALGRQHGLPVIGGMSIAELRDVLLKAGVQLGPLAASEWPERFAHVPQNHGNVTEVVTVTVTEPVTETVTEIHTHAPLPTVTGVPVTHRASASAGEVCKAMRASGVVGVNPSHPGLLALLAAGCTVDHLAMCAATAAAKGKGFAYALGIAEGQMREAATREPSALEVLAPSLFKPH